MTYLKLLALIRVLVRENLCVRICGISNYADFKPLLWYGFDAVLVLIWNLNFYSNPTQHPVQSDQTNLPLNHWSIYFYEANDNYSGQFPVSIEVIMYHRFQQKKWTAKSKRKLFTYLLTSALEHQKQNTKFKGTNIRRSNQDRWKVCKFGTLHCQCTG